jgi:hypothetical protein
MDDQRLIRAGSFGGALYIEFGIQSSIFPAFRHLLLVKYEQGENFFFIPDSPNL